MPSRSRRTLLRYGVAIAAVAVVTLLKEMLGASIGPSSTLVLFLSAVALAGWHGGLGPGLLATAMAGLAYVELEVVHARAAPSPAGHDDFRICAFLLEGMLISGLMDAWRAARRRAEEQSRKRRAGEERFRRIVELASEGIWTFDARGRCDYANARLAQMLGYSAREVLGLTMFDLMDPADRQSAEQSLRLRLLGSAEMVDFRFRRRDGSDLRAIVSTSPILDDAGRGDGFVALVTDVTARTRAEQALRDSEALYHSLVENIPHFIFRKDLDGRYTFGNRRFCELLGTTPERLVGKTDFDLHPAELAQKFRADDRRVTEQGTVVEVEEQHPAAGGPPIAIRTAKCPIRDGAGRIVGVQGIFADVTERNRVEQALRDSEERYRLLFESNPHPMWVFDPETLEFLAVNQAAVEGYGYARDEFLSMRLTDIQPAEDAAALRRWVAEWRDVPHRNWGQWRHRRKGGEQIDVEVMANSIPFEGRPAKVALVHDVTARKRAEQQLEHQATHDALTGLPNRVHLQQQVERCVQDGPTPFALLLIDLDRFKEINDTLGHHYGDLVLRQLNPRLRRAVRKSDTVARLGGDEFGILLPAADEAAAVRAARKILEALRQPIVLDGHRLDVGASIGVALYPEHGRDAIALLKRADVAMYKAKRAQAGHVVFAADPCEYSPRRLALVAELRQAIDEGRLSMHYQPRIDLRTMRPGGAEALIRWHHPREGTIPPSQFIPLAEHTGLIRPLGLWALRAALQQCRGWHQAGINLEVAVNLGTGSLQDEALAATVARLLDEADSLPGWLTVEITESAMMADPVRARETLARLHDMGVRIAIDDFGIGYSSLAYLKQLPVDEVKVDRSFVAEMLSSEHDACIVRAVIDLGHNLGLRVVAEGVEDGETAGRLAAWGCDSAQGYFFSHPLAPDRLIEWMARPAGLLSPA
jgi:diguanylate cyclase (GGDEF)-like protein/PAS domain S-box-containing protein